ncbi:MAG: hypothetical protein WDM81_12195 [Rhizomicrobium sp.]
MLNSAVESQAGAAAQCRASFDNSIARLERGRQPVASVPMPAPATPASDFTVYFDFDSWSLSGEQLGVLQKAIAAARAGGQSRIAVVGHTDTSDRQPTTRRFPCGAPMSWPRPWSTWARGARPSRSPASARPISRSRPADGVREPKNRRGVITLSP